MPGITNKEFKIVDKIKQLIIITDDIIENVPKKDFIYKDSLKHYLIELLNNVYYLNYYKEEIEVHNKFCQIKSTISMIDFLLEKFFLKHYISEKQLIIQTKLLTEINKMSTTWIKNKFSLC